MKICFDYTSHLISFLVIVLVIVLVTVLVIYSASLPLSPFFALTNTVSCVLMLTEQNIQQLVETNTKMYTFCGSNTINGKKTGISELILQFFP